MSIKSNCRFQYWNGETEYWDGDCFCGSKKEHFLVNYHDKYCCVHQNSPQDCRIDVSTNGMWCPNATLLSFSHICNNNCYYDDQKICPNNPEACMDMIRGCDGRDRCEAFCTGPLENFPFYDQTAKQCIADFGDKFPYCGKRDEAKYHNHQCKNGYGSLKKDTAAMIPYSCLNRKDVSENFIRSSVNYNSFVSARKNLFQYFKANDTRNQVTETQIICGDQKLDMDCYYVNQFSTIECKKEETDSVAILVSSPVVCDALDFLEDKGLPPPSASWTWHIYRSPSGMLCN